MSPTVNSPLPAAEPPPAAPPAKVKKEIKRQKLGNIGHKEYYYEQEFHDSVLFDKRVVWRVPDIREAVRATPGFKIFGGDFSQIEIKIMAFLSGDPFLINAINSKDPKTGKGTDFHCYMTSQVYEIPYDEFFYIAKIANGEKEPEHPLHKQYATMRSNTKTVVFGIPLILAACQSNLTVN